MTSELADRGNVLWLLSIRVQRESVRNLPDEDLSIVGSGSNDTVVEGIPMRTRQLESQVYCKQGGPHCSPVSIKHRRSVSSEQRNLLWQATLLIQGNDSKGTTTASLPVHSEVFRVDLATHALPVSIHPSTSIAQAEQPYLDQIGVPRIATDVQVIVGGFLPRRLPKYVSLMPMSARRVRDRGAGRGEAGEVIRYFDARTKRPAIRAHPRVEGLRGCWSSTIAMGQSARTWGF